MENLTDEQLSFFEKVMHWLHRLRTETFCPTGEGMIVHRPRLEVDCLESLPKISSEWLEACLIAGCVEMASWVLIRAQVRVEFRFLRKKGSYRKGLCLNERRMQYRYGLFIRYQCLETVGSGTEFCSRAFPLLVRNGEVWKSYFCVV